MSPERNSIQSYYDQYWTEVGHRPSSIGPSAQEDTWFQTYLPSRRPLLLLDVGCGDGSKMGPWCRSHGVNYTGVEISLPAVTAAKAAGHHVVSIKDLDSLPFKDASFDALTCLEVLEHLFLPYQAVAECRRVLKPHGLMLLSVPNVAYWRNRIDLLLAGRWNPNGDADSIKAPWRDPHIRFFNRPILVRMLQNAGFEVLGAHGVHGGFLGSLPILNHFVIDRDGVARISFFYRFLQKMNANLFAARLIVAAAPHRDTLPLR